MTSENKDQRFAAEMKAWMMIQVIGQTSVNFLNVKKLKKEMTEYLKTLGEAVKTGESRRDYSAVSAEDAGAPEQGSFAAPAFCDYFIDTCLTSKSYRTAVFGTMSMSDAGAATRIAQDIIEVTETIPKRFGLEAEAAPVKAAMLKAFQNKVENSTSIFQELHIW